MIPNQPPAAPSAKYSRGNWSRSIYAGNLDAWCKDIIFCGLSPRYGSLSTVYQLIAAELIVLLSLVRSPYPPLLSHPEPYTLENKRPHTDTTDQADLLLRVAGGDERAFARLVRQYGDTIFSQSLAFVKSVPQAEELTQDIFMKVWRNRGKLSEVDNFENWLFILARNLIFDSFKAKVNSPPQFAGSNDTELLTPDLQAEHRDTYQLLLRGIEQLPEKRRQVFRMSRLEGMSHEQIAEALGIHKVTVAQYIVKSLSFLKSYLEDHTGDTILVIILLRGLP